MDAAVGIVTLVLAAGLVGMTGYLAREFGRQMLSRDLERFKVTLEAQHDAEVARLRTDLTATIGSSEADLARVRADLQQAAREHEAELKRLRERHGEVVDLVTRGLEQLKSDFQARHDTAMERLRLASSASADNGRLGQLRERRAEVIAELYKRLAKIEATIASLTNPFLLPGEPYAAPAELVNDSLQWDNWKDVGDAAYAFADYFNQHRLQVDDPTARAITAFITRLRTALTRSIYPNLQPQPTAEQRQTLRGALDQIAADLPDIRQRIERQFRELLGDTPIDSDDPHDA